MKTVDIKGYEKYYTISENGSVFSKRKGRFMRQSVNGVYNSYRKVFLMIDGWCSGKIRPRFYLVHRLVLEHFVGPCPVGMECHHIDHDKSNNHVSNLEWVTHSENILRSFTEGGREGYWLGKKKEAFSEETRSKMAMAKWVPIRVSNSNETYNYESIGACADGMGTYREKIYRYLRSGKLLNGYKLERLS